MDSDQKGGGSPPKTAIKHLEAKFQSSKYIIEADFSKAFDSIPHEKLLEILKKDIKCDKTLTLIKSGLNAGFAEKGILHESSQTGTPQGSILSPLLCNIYLNELDQFMETLKEEFDKGSRKPKSAEYTKLTNKARYWRNKGFDISNPTEYQKILETMSQTPSMAQNENYTRIQYVRYEDDFIIGVEGSFEQANMILEKVSKFVKEELLLEFNPDKTGITKWDRKPVKFLGYTMSAPTSTRSIKPLETVRMREKFITRRKKMRIRIFMDKEKVLSRLMSKKLITKRKSHADHKKSVYRGRFAGNMINMDHADILRYYNSIIRGIHNYYDIVDNRSDLLHLIWLITESCALTLALKFKFKTLKKTFYALGDKLAFKTIDSNGKVKLVTIIKPAELRKGSLAHIKTPNPSFNLEMSWNAKFT
jgi:hypothetical protein